MKGRSLLEMGDQPNWYCEVGDSASMQPVEDARMMGDQASWQCEVGDPASMQPLENPRVMPG